MTRGSAVFFVFAERNRSIYLSADPTATKTRQVHIVDSLHLFIVVTCALQCNWNIFTVFDWCHQ